MTTDKSRTMRIDLIPDISEIPLAERPKASFVVTHQEKTVLPSGDSARSYSELFQNIYDAGVITDLRGRIRDVNRRALDAFGYTSSDFCNLDFFDIVAGSDEELVRTLYENVQHERFTLMQAYCVRSDGSAFPAEIAVSQIRLSTPHLTFFIRDTTLRRQTVEMLRTEHNALQNANDAIVVIDLSSKIEYVNPAAAKMWHYFEPGDLIGHNLGDLLQNPDEGAAVMNSLAGEQYSMSNAVMARRSDGEIFRAQMNVACNRNSDGDVIGAVISFIDLTERERVLSSEKTAHKFLNALDRVRDCHNSLVNSMADLGAFLKWLPTLPQLSDNTKAKSKIDDALAVWEGHAALVAEIREIIDNAVKSDKNVPHNGK